MWQCSGCHEKLDEQFDCCWKCGTSRYEKLVEPNQSNINQEQKEENERLIDKTTEEIADNPNRILHTIYRLQKQQALFFKQMEWKIGCLFYYMIFSIAITVLSILVALSNR